MAVKECAVRKCEVQSMQVYSYEENRKAQGEDACTLTIIKWLNGNNPTELQLASKATKYYW
jgi:ArsR family metal-binding transcriptional regulator